VLLSTATLLMLLQSFGAVPVVDLPGLGVRQRFVCFCYLAELLGSFGLVGVLVRMPFLRQRAVRPLDVSFGGALVDS
jgi:hypothetical protein